MLDIIKYVIIILCCNYITVTFICFHKYLCPLCINFLNALSSKYFELKAN